MSDPLEKFAKNSGNAGETYGGKTEPATEWQAKTYIEQASQQTSASVSWSDIKDDIDTVNGYLTDGARSALAITGLDGVALEFSVGADAGIVLGGELATGISVFWPLHSEYDPADDKKAPAGTPHPVDDAPHFYLFSSRGLTFGVDLGGGAGVGAQLVFADHWGGADRITRGSWGGSVVSFDIDGALSLGVGAEVSITAYFTAVSSTGEGPDGTVTWTTPDAGWHGAGIAASPKAGAEIELTTGITVTNALSDVIEFGRPDVEQAMQDAVKIPESGDLHYHRPEQGPGFIHWLIEGLTEL